MALQLPRKADNLTAICELFVYKMWEPQPLIPLWAFTACYWDSFTRYEDHYTNCFKLHCVDV
jgi:hypothetical protein